MLGHVGSIEIKREQHESIICISLFYRVSHRNMFDSFLESLLHFTHDFYSFEKKHGLLLVSGVRADDKIKSPLGHLLRSISIFLYGHCFDFMLLTFTLTFVIFVSSIPSFTIDEIV